MTSETKDSDVLSSKEETKVFEDDVSKQVSPDSTSQVPSNLSNAKQHTRILPFVFLQASTNMKVPTTIVTMSNPSSLVTVPSPISTPLIVNANINNLNTKLKTNTTMTSKTTQIILQKSGNGATGQTLIPVSVATSTGTKQTFAYLGALLKNNGKSGESQILVSANQLPAGLVKNSVKSGDNQIILPSLVKSTCKNDNQIVVSNNQTSLVKSATKSGENAIVVSNHLPVGLVPSPNNQKLVLAPMAMPKLSTRLPATCPTNSVTHPKIANIILPMPINQVKPTQSVINFKISNGQIQSDPKGSITVLCDSDKNINETQCVSDVTSTTIEKKDSVTEVIISSSVSNNLPKVVKSAKNNSDKQYELSEVIINSSIANNPPKVVKNAKSNKNTDKQYELSIPEEPKSVNYTIKLSDDMKTYKIERNGQEIDAINADLPKNEQKKQINNTPSVIVHTKSENHRKPHEASILKKSIRTYEINTYERKTYSKVPIIPKPESKMENVTITKEIAETKIIPEKKQTQGRRKSQYTYLRDFDEIVTSGNVWKEKNKSQIDKYSKRFENAEITFTKLNSPENDVNTENDIKKIDDFVEIEVIKQEYPKFNTDDVNDIKSALEWKDDIGSLPGSKLKFHINEYGLVELLTGDDYKKNIENKEEVVENEILNCRECGCYGMPSEFISRNYCSNSCKVNAITNIEKLKRDVYLKENKAKKKKKNKQEIIQKQEDLKNEIVDSEGDSNDLSQDKINYPWQGGKKGFSWAKYLDHVKAKAAPLKLFKDPFPYNKNGFRVGMKLEGIDPQHQSYYCVMTVAEVQGYRMRLHFDGYSDSYDFWTNVDSMNIFPMGWCEKYNHSLFPPPGYTTETFNWTIYLKNCKATAAPRHLFSNRAGNSICPNGFRLGMKLEAVDRKNSSLVCVATVRDLMDNRFLVHFDSWDEMYDYWADPSSPYIHPVGWCDKYLHSLTPPIDYPNPEQFTWETYLSFTKSTPAPARAFKQRPSSGFRRGMRVECVDRRVPQLVRVATVDDVCDHRVRIRFDGWPDKYSYWLDDDNNDIHPPGWCQKTGHIIEGPLMPEDVFDNFDECSTVGCRGIGHILGALYDTHDCARDCPYSDENLIDPPVLPDRLSGSHDSGMKSRAAVPIQREPKNLCKQPRLCKAPKIRRLTETEVKEEWPIEEDSSDSIKRRKIATRDPSPTLSDNKYKISEEIQLFKQEFKSEYVNPSQLALAKHTKLLDEVIGYSCKDPRLWTENEVSEFVNSIPSCTENVKVFVKEMIDGEAFLMLTQKDLVDVLKFKLGPAIKLYNSILLLRKNVNLYN